MFLDNTIIDFRRRCRASIVMKFIISITSEFGLFISMIAEAEIRLVLFSFSFRVIS